MSAWRFSCDCIGAEHIAALVMQPAVGLDRWLVLDAALFDDKALDTALRGLPPQRFNTLDASPLAAFGKRAPWAFRLDADDRDRTVRTLAALYRNAPRAPALSAISTAAGPEMLKRTFAYLATPLLDEMPVHCRFADTRVLPRLLRCLMPEQQAPVAASIAEWTWFDRSGQRDSWAPAKRAATPASLTLKLDSTQYGALLEAAEADSMTLLLEESTPELVPEDAGAAFHGRLNRILAAANELRVDGSRDRLQFVVLSLSLGEGFHRAVCLAPTWRAVAQGGSLTQAIASWDGDVWDLLEAQRADQRSVEVAC